MKARPRSGYTIIELVIVLAMLSIMAALLVPQLSFTKYRQDGAARAVQQDFIRCQQIAMKFGYNVLFTIDVANSRVRIVRDTNSNGAIDSSDPQVPWRLPDQAKFVIPGTTVDGATAYYATGAGVASTSNGPQITCYPSGSASGDAYVYIGVGSGATDALRAIEFEGATARTRLWRYRNGAWRRDST